MDEVRYLVSIHAPWEGCDRVEVLHLTDKEEFQFTHPGKGATLLLHLLRQLWAVSIHAPWEGCDALTMGGAVRVVLVSIHAPWEGCDSTHRSRRCP